MAEGAQKEVELPINFMLLLILLTVTKPYCYKKVERRR